MIVVFIILKLVPVLNNMRFAKLLSFIMAIRVHGAVGLNAILHSLIVQIIPQEIIIYSIAKNKWI